MPTGLKNPPAFHELLRTLIDKNLGGNLSRAADVLGVSPETVRGWVKGRRVPRFTAQTAALRTLRAISNR